jgi:acetoin utilization protein AcuB
MEDEHLRHLPVVRGDMLLGMLSERDVLTAVGGLLASQRRAQRGQREVTLGPTRVREVMSREVHTLVVDGGLHEAARLMSEQKIGAVPLLKDGRLEAIVCDTDLLRALRDMCLSAPPEHPCYHPVGKYMTRQVYTVSPEARIDVAVEAFGEKHFRHLPVLEDGRLVGIVSDRDVRRAVGMDAVLGSQARVEGDVLIGCERIADVMDVDPQFISPQAAVSQAAHMMLGERLGSLCVVDERILVGIVTETDLIRILASDAN